MMDSRATARLTPVQRWKWTNRRRQECCHDRHHDTSDALRCHALDGGGQISSRKDTPDAVIRSRGSAPAPQANIRPVCAGAQKSGCANEDLAGIMRTMITGSPLRIFRIIRVRMQRERASKNYEAEKGPRWMSEETSRIMDRQMKEFLRWRAETKEKRNRRAAARRRGLAVADVLRPENEQDNCCGICGKEERAKRLCIDHCHASGNIRGLLCHKCNTLLGCADDSPTLLVKAIAYLKRAETNCWNPRTQELIRLARAHGDDFKLAAYFESKMQPSYK